MTAAVPWAALAVLAVAALLVLVGKPASRWWVAYERHRDRPQPSIDQASHDRADAVHDPQEETDA